jgi:hypothetical protein
MGGLVHGSQFRAATDGRSPNAIAIVGNAVGYFEGLLISQGQTTDVTQISRYLSRWCDVPVKPCRRKTT